MPGKRQRGFSLMELMVVLAILTLIMGIVFTAISDVQKRSQTESQRLGITQGTREFMDQVERDLRNVGYPNIRMYGNGILNPNPYNRSYLAAGLFAVSATDIWFEADVDGTGQVSSVRYTLVPDADGNCPCTLQRSSVYKLAGRPDTQSISMSSEIGNVVNSAGDSAAWTIAGNTADGSANDTVYASFKTAALFEFYDSGHNRITVPTTLSGTNLQTGKTASAGVVYVVITANVLAPYADQQTGLRPATTMRTSIRLTNL